MCLLLALSGLFLTHNSPADPVAAFDGTAIVFGGEASYPPFEWRDQGNAMGLNVDLQRAIADVGGVQAEHRLGNWPDVIRDLKLGTVDVVAMFHSEDRERDFRFTRPFSFVNHAIYGPSDARNISSVDDLLPARVAVEKHSYAQKRLQQMHDHTPAVLAANTVEALEAVLQGRADYAIVSEPAADYLIASKQMSLRPIGSPLWPAEYAFAVRKDRVDLARWLDDQLEIVVESGLYRDIQSRWKDRWDPPGEEQTSRWLILGVLPLAATLLFGGWWAWTLRRTLMERGHRLIDEARLRNQAESRLSWAADHNTETDMPKHHRFVQLAEQVVEGTPRGQKQVVVALKLAELDRTIRTLGHEAGLDSVRNFAKRLRDGDFPVCGQMGRDVFAIFGDKTRIEREFRGLKLVNDTVAMRAPHPRVFAGAATWPQHGETVSELLRKAESALSRAIERREGWIDFRPFMEPNAEELQLVSLFRDQGAGVIYPVFQPQIDLTTGQIIGAEALARWDVAGLGEVSPGVFIPLLEDAGLITHVTRRMVTAAVRVAAKLRRYGYPCPVSVNVTGNDLLGWKLSRSIFASLREHGGIAADLKLELTETGVVDRPEVLQWKMRRLVKESINISVDDFGTGYSSLAYLSDFPVQEIKIDQSFVRGMLRQNKDMDIIASTISMGHKLGLIVVAEGVENEEAFDTLRRLGCDRAQGYFISRPLAEQEFIEYLAREGKSARQRDARGKLAKITQITPR